MKQIIVIKRSTVAGKKPENNSLRAGELAVNLVDRILYTSDTNGTVFRINPEIDPTLSTTSTNPIQNSAVANAINTANTNITSLDTRMDTAETNISNKVDKVTGKGLSTNDYTDEEKTKVSKITIDGTASLFLAEDGIYHRLTKTLVGLDNVDNTADLNKPISNAVDDALSLKADKSDTYTKAEVDQKVSSAFQFKGVLDNFTDTSTVSSPSNGHIYLVRNAFESGDVNYPANTTIVYDGSSWIPLGTGLFDMSNYVTKAELEDYVQGTQIDDPTQII